MWVFNQDEPMRESIFFASLRVFFLSMFAVIGFILGIVLILALIGGISGNVTDGDPQITYKYTPEIKPNADGVRKELTKEAPVILQIDISGVIGLDSLTHQNVQQQLIEAQERSLKDRVKAILLYINTPGGTVMDADGIYRAIKRYKELHKVPVYAFVDGLCASGGMMVACSADKILSNDVSLVGSVGVIIPTFFNVSQLLEKWNIQTKTLYEGHGKDNMNPLTPWHKGDDQNIRDAVSYYYAMFVDTVTSNRPKMDKSKLIDVYGANIYPAITAKEYGYIDETGTNISAAIKQLAEKIGITDDYYQVIALESRSWLSQLFNSKLELLNGQVTHHLEISPEMNPKLMNHYLYLYRP